MTNLFWIIAWFLGMYAGWYLRQSQLENSIKKMQQEEEAERASKRFRPSIKDDVINAIIERDKDIFYVYAKEDGIFLAQGKSASEITERLTERFPDKKFYVTESNVSEVDYK